MTERNFFRSDFAVDRFGEALRLEQVYVPSEVVVGQSATLQCRYDLEGEMLYSVKWYKNGREFFRIVPNDTPPSQIFPVEGIRVNVSLTLILSNSMKI